MKTMHRPVSATRLWTYFFSSQLRPVHYCNSMLGIPVTCCGMKIILFRFSIYTDKTKLSAVVKFTINRHLVYLNPTLFKPASFRKLDYRLSVILCGIRQGCTSNQIFFSVMILASDDYKNSR